jgi:hypothetical protein
MASCSSQDIIHFQVYLSEGKYIMEMGSTIIWSQDHKKLTRLISSIGRHLTWPAAIRVEVIWELFRIQTPGLISVGCRTTKALNSLRLF